jgi:anti-sigma factor RsiW
MSKHVAHLLAAYVERQLRPEQAAYVYQHVTECPSCRARLAYHENLVDDLRLRLGQWPVLRPERVTQLWLAAGSPATIPTSRMNTFAVLPLLLGLLLVLVPLTTGFTTIVPSPALAVTAFHSPGEVVAQALLDGPRAGANPLPDSQQDQVRQAATPAIPETPIPAAPAPLAPTDP